jgi:hypothetical protein
MILGSATTLIAFILLLTSIRSFAQESTRFDPGCQLPFEAIALEHDGVDDVCGIQGITSPDDKGNQQQNRIKNNFCLKDQPLILKPDDLVALQKKVDDLDDFTYGSGRSVPLDRSPLKNIGIKNGSPYGEGTLVTVVGFLIDLTTLTLEMGKGLIARRAETNQTTSTSISQISGLMLTNWIKRRNRSSFVSSSAEKLVPISAQKAGRLIT